LKIGPIEGKRKANAERRTFNANAQSSAFIQRLIEPYNIGGLGRFWLRWEKSERKNENIWRIFAAGAENDLGRPVLEGKKQPEFSNFHSA
jgi:hypothetical protein